ncbi:MAG: hypothetical protein JWN88_2945 [Frankiales bacterium]|nr:hypothetical protein [Frankiales bacterium]
MEQRRDDPSDRHLHLVAALLVEAGEPRLEPGQLGGDDLVGPAPQGDHGGGDPGGALPRQEVADLLGDDGAHGFDVGPRLGGSQLVLQRRQVDEGDARELAHVGVDVPGQGQVEDRQGAPTARLHGTGDDLALDDDPGRAGRGDDDVGLGQRGLEPVEPHTGPAQGVRQPLRVLGRPVRHDDVAGAGPTQDRAGERPHRPGTDDEHAATLERPDRGHGTLQAHRHQRAPGAVDARLAVGALADPQRALEQLVQGGPGRLVADGRVGAPQLPEDLRLTDHHRVEPAGDLEQVEDRGALPVHVEVPLQLVERDP